MPKKENIRFLIWHITAGSWGTVESVRKFHTDPQPHGRGWRDIGYHYLITNCYPTYDSIRYKRPVLGYDGHIWPGRDIDHDGDVDEEIGAHCLGYNSRSLGISLVGTGGEQLTGNQLEAAIDLSAELIKKYPAIEGVLGHYETGANKTCPDLDMEYIRALINARFQ